MKNCWWNWNAVTRAGSPFAAILRFITKSLLLPTLIQARSSTPEPGPFGRPKSPCNFLSPAQESGIRSNGEFRYYLACVPKECLELKTEERLSQRRNKMKRSVLGLL